MANQYDSYSDPTIAYEEYAASSPAFAREQALAQNPQAYAQNPMAPYTPAGTGAAYPVLKYRYRGDTRFGLIVMINAVLVAVIAFVLPLVLGAVLATIIVALVSAVENGSSDPFNEFWGVFAISGIAAVLMLIAWLVTVAFDIYTVIAAIVDTARWRRFRGLTGSAGILVALIWGAPILVWLIGWANWESITRPGGTDWFPVLIFLTFAAVLLMRTALFVLGIVRLVKSDYIADYPDTHPALAEARAKGIDVDAARRHRAVLNSW